MKEGSPRRDAASGRIGHRAKDTDSQSPSRYLSRKIAILAINKALVAWGNLDNIRDPWGRGIGIIEYSMSGLMIPG
jgi:hypothetical protein